MNAARTVPPRTEVRGGAVEGPGVEGSGEAPGPSAVSPAGVRGQPVLAQIA